MPDPPATHRAVIVIDVLRATTVIVCALANGAREVIPVAGVDAARDLAKSRGGALLGGEERNERIPGFDFGNSPQEYDARVREKTVVLRTTNGTRALQAFRGVSPVWCGAFANASAIVRALARPAVSSATLVCAGQAGEFSLEDFVCAGALVDGIGSLRETHGDDEAIAARELFRANRGALAALLEQGNHALALRRAGFGSDIPFAAKLDRYDVLPALEDGAVVASPPT